MKCTIPGQAFIVHAKKISFSGKGLFLTYFEGWACGGSLCGEGQRGDQDHKHTGIHIHAMRLSEAAQSGGGV